MRGQLSLDELAALVPYCRVVIGNDSGPPDLAARVSLAPNDTASRLEPKA